MLSELHELAKSLEELGIEVSEIHPWVKPLSRGTFLVADLDNEGSVHAVEIRGESDSASIPKIQKDNQNTFPTFKLAFPLIEVGVDAELRRALKSKALNDGARAALIREAMAEFPPESVKKNSKRLAQLIVFAGEVHGHLSEVLPDSPALARLIEVLRNRTPEPANFLRSLRDAMLAALERGEDTRTAQLVLIGEVSKKGEIKGEIPLVLDVYREPGDEFDRVAHAKTGILYSKALLQRGEGEADGVCSITGRRTALERGNLPSPRLPALGDTILFSANRDIPCLQRYGLIGSGAFPIGSDTAQKLSNTALWITAPQRKGKTWSLVPRSDDTGRDLVLAYVDLDPDVNAEVAALLSESNATAREGAFESKAATVIKAIDELRGKMATAAVLHTLVLRRISKGQVQVEVSREYKLERIREALGEWEAAAANAPMLSLMVPTGKGKPAMRVDPRVPFPGDVVDTTKWIWIRGGSERQPTAGISLASVYDLYLGEDFTLQASALAILERVLRQCTPLLLLTGDQLTRFGMSVQGLSVPARYSALQTIALMGICLYKIGRRKELYMKETAFSLGRMLALSDVLHAQYCRVVRDGQLPPQLLGNQHFAMASVHPSRAFSTLGDRLRVYKAWADTAKPKSDEQQNALARARRAVREMGVIATMLHNGLPERGLNDIDRAEMLLGYLAREMKESESTND